MGKTPEKGGDLSLFPVYGMYGNDGLTDALNDAGELALRYRPKVVKDPTTGAQPLQLPVSDNQREHESVDDPATRKKRPVFMRKKKVPAMVTQKARSFSDSTAASSLALTPETTSVEIEQNPKATLVKKDVKAKNRRTAHDPALKEEDNQHPETAAAATTPEVASAPIAPVPKQAATPVARYPVRKPYKKDFQKRHGSAPTKQVLWKAKYPQPAAIAEPLQVATQQQEQVITPAQDEEDEELAYTLQERQSIKLHAADEITKRQQHMTFPVESSSQETQSGSEDESSFLQFSSFIPNVMMESTAIMEGALEQYFPEPYPLEALAAIRNSGGFVHEIVLEGFMFAPAELAIHVGDVVVWHVSSGTLGMVEHCLELSFQPLGASNGVVYASTPPLTGGSFFAWRFESAGLVHVDCAVYKTRGVINVVDSNSQEVDEINKPVIEFVKRRKTKTAAKKPKRKAVAAAQSELETDISSRQETETVTVFHPPKYLSRLPNVDAGVCRAVLAHLEDVRMSTPVIVIGDVACPVLETSGSDSIGAEVEVANEVGGFQQHIIAMLKKSEEGQVRKRNSFLLPQSPFDAASSYDFFKRRYGDVKNAEQRIIYCNCPEQTSAYSSLGAMDLVNLLRM